jgi:4-amino-4-deoxy-L-arabinose transferase-like glycosyltransferase
MTQAFITIRNRPWLVLAGILTVYAILLLPTLDRQGISWDEQNDLWIAQAYLQPDGWLEGSQIDLSQARLPMFSVALVYRLLGVADLLTARWVSALVGALTLLGVYLYGRERFSAPVGLVAVGILAISPFYLSFARVAFTETDIFLACTLAWLMVLVGRLQERPTLGNAILAGLMLGLAISAKATALAVLPAVWFTLWQVRQDGPIEKSLTPQVWLWAGWLSLVLLVGWDTARSIDPRAYTGGTRLAHYSLVTLCGLLPLAWAIHYQHLGARRLALAAFITALGLLTCFLLPPEHLTNPGVLDSLLWRADNETSFNPAFMGEAFALHALCVALKSTPAIGLGLLAGMGWAAFRFRHIPAVRLPLLVGGLYLGGLILLPIAQTFYAIPLLPGMSILAAGMFMEAWQQRRRLAQVLAVVALGWWALEMAQCYPDYNLNGYQWLGARPLFGRSSISYRSVVMTPSDGVQQVMEWLNANAKPGESAQLYIMPWHIVQTVAPDPQYRIFDGNKRSLAGRPDYVVVEINSIIWNGWGTDTPVGEVIRLPYDAAVLGRDYELAYSVKRRFGLEVAWVWKRK